MSEDFSENPIQYRDLSKNEENFLRIAAMKDGNLAGVCSYAQVTKPEGNNDAVEIIKSKMADGVPTYMGRVTVDNGYSGQGIGLKLLLEAQRMLLEKNDKMVEMLVDDSLSPASKNPIGWTERQLPKLLESAHARGFDTNIIFQGETDDKPTWLIEYTKIPAE